MMRGRAELALLFNTLVWGTTFVLVKTALDDVSPILFVALRFTLAAALLLVIFRRKWPAARETWKAVRGGALAGIFLFCGYLFQTLGLRFTTASKSAFITGLSSVMVPLLASLVYKNRPRMVEVAGVLVATAGMGLLLIGDVFPIAHGQWMAGRGDLLTLICAVAFAAHIVTLGHYAEEVNFEVLSVVQVSTTAVLALVLFGWAETPRLDWHPAVIYAILVTGVLATALAFSIQAWAQRYTTSTRTALIFTLEPVFAWMTSFWLLGESLSGRAAAGAALILGGIVMVEMKPLSSRLHPSK
ncbi:MAG TPA: DMT family transporter [Bryobacteraceae bacterium]|nr:DMT family transporter [Bryobacteraceae bacterium]